MASNNSKGWCWWIERGKLGLAKTENYGKSFTSPEPSDSAFNNVRIFCSALADHFPTGSSMNLDSATSDIPDIFHEALISKVHQMIYEMNPQTINLAQYWGDKYRLSVMEAKRYVNTNRTEKTHIMGEDY